MSAPLARSSLVAALHAQTFDAVIIGGGIVGAGVARDAAMRGLKVALIEQSDFASGTSSKTSKLIHGGLRYLEHGHHRLVRESLRERFILRSIAPSLVQPRQFLLPAYGGAARPAWQLHAGLWLYDLLAGRHQLRGHRWLSGRRALGLEPGLRAEGLRAAGLYTDCQMDDARLVLVNILQAIAFGAVCVNYVRMRELLRAQGVLSGVAAEDLLTGSTVEIRAGAVINATGPWGDQVRHLSDRGAAPRLAPTKGSHLLVRRLAQEALFVPHRRDRRMVFILPWGADYSLIGTTESAVTGALETLAADREDVGYLLEAANHALPGARLGEDDVVGTFAGARPLLAFEGGSTQAPREHRLEIDRWGLISILGGKYTTYRVMARHVVDVLFSRRPGRAERCLTDQVSLLEPVQPVTVDHWQHLTKRLDPDLLARLLGRYGVGTFHLLRLLDHEPALLRRICPHHEHIDAELVYAFQQELACTVTDVLARRLPVAWSACQGLDVLPRLEGLMQRFTDHSPQTVREQMEQYRYFLDRSLGWRHARRPAPPPAAPAVR